MLSNSKRKTEFIREYKKLKLQEEFIEKILSSTLRGLKIDFHQEQHKPKTATAERQEKFHEVTMRGVLGILNELKCLKSILQESDPSVMKDLDVTDCGSRLTRLSEKIEDLKRVKSDLDSMRREEEALDSYLRDFERAIFTEKTAKQQNSMKNSNERKCPTRSDVNDEFTELVARTGHTQGWSDEDHSFFIKMRNRYDSVPQLVNEMKKKRPHLTTEEIVNHEAWLKLYTELREKRKKEIAEWRSSRVNGIYFEGTENALVSSVDPISAKKTDMNIDNKKVLANEESKLNNDTMKRKLIKEWKADRMRKSAMDEEQKKRLERARIREEKRRRETRQSETLNKLNKYKEEKEKAKSYGDQEVPTFQSRTQDSLRLIKAFREQDERFIQRRLASRLNKESEKEFVSNRTRDSRLNNNSSTLFKPTKGWEEKCKRDLNQVELFKRVNYVKDIQRLSAPRDTASQNVPSKGG